VLEVADDERSISIASAAEEVITNNNAEKIIILFILFFLSNLNNLFLLRFAPDKLLGT